MNALSRDRGEGVFFFLKRPSDLKPGGRSFIYTHFAFPIHGYLSDYWRFTREALETIFVDAGCTIIGSDYENPARIVSEADPDTQNCEAFTGVRIVVEKRLL